MDTIDKYYRSFSGTDAMAFLLFPSSTPVLLGSLTTISYSIFREKVPVKIMSRISIPTYTKGLRYCAGTMIFTMINKHWVNEVKVQVPYLSYYGKIKADELPPFDIMIICANEYGSSASMMILAAEISDEAQTISIEDILTENQFSFICKDINIMDSDGSSNIKLTDPSTTFVQPWTSIITTDLAVLSPDEEKRQREAEAIKRSTMNIFVNGDKINFPDSQPFIDENSRVVAPLRFIFDKMGWKAYWNSTTRTANFKYDPSISESGWGVVKVPKYNLNIDFINNKVSFVVRNDGSDFGTTWNDIILTKNIILDAKDRAICELRPLFEQAINKYITEDEQKWKVTWGGSDGKSVFIDNVAASNHPVISMDSNSNGTFVEEAQALLNENGIKLNISGVYDYTTQINVTLYQMSKELPSTGKVDQATWSSLIQKNNKIDLTKYPKKAIVIDKGGAYIRKMPDMDSKNILSKLTYNQNISVTSPDNGGWVTVTSTVVKIAVKGWMQSKDLKYI